MLINLLIYCRSNIYLYVIIILYLIKIKKMEIDLKQKRTVFLLSLSVEEKKRLQIMAVEKGMALNKLIISTLLPPNEKV